MASLAGHLEDLYGATLSAAASKLGDQQVLEAAFSCPSPQSLRAAGGDGQAARLPGHGASLLVKVFADPARPEGLPGSGLRPDYVREEKENLGRDQASISDERMSYAHYRCLAEMCAGEPNALHSLGRPEDLGAIAPGDLDALRLEITARAPLVAYLAGPVDDRMTAEIAEVFGELAASAGAGAAGTGAAGVETRAAAGAARRDIPPSRPHGRPEREKEIIEPAEVEQARLVVGLQTGVLLGDAEAPAQALYNGLLGGFVHSRLFRAIREEAGLAYYAWSRVLPTKGLILISCGIQEKNYGRAVELIRRELGALAAGDFTDSEFEATRNSILAVAKAMLDSPSNLVYGHLERVAAGRAPEEIAPWRELARVTPDQVRDFGRRPVLDTVYLLGRDESASGGTPGGSGDAAARTGGTPAPGKEAGARG